MECCEPGVIRDEELVAYLEGEFVRPLVIEHLARCRSCSEQVEQYRQLERSLLKRLYRWNCPISQELGEYHLGLLSNERATMVQRHLQACVLCANEIAALSDFIGADPLLVERPMPKESIALPSGARNHHQPFDEVQRAFGYFHEQLAAGARRIVATLLPPPPRLAFQRDVPSSASAWPRSYRAEDLTVSVQVEQSLQMPGTLQMLGFVTQQGKSVDALHGIQVVLSQQLLDQKVIQQQIDDLGNFMFDALEPSTYMLEIQLPDHVVAIESLALDEQVG